MRFPKRWRTTKAVERLSRARTEHICDHDGCTDPESCDPDENRVRDRLLRGAVGVSSFREASVAEAGDS